MDKMRMESIDMTAQNIEKIGALFPNCITETKDADGKPKKAINFDLLRQMLSGDVIEGDEAYEFTWVGKKAAIVEANKPIRKTLRPCKEESVNWDSTENLYIEGDNLEVLKLLQESYLGKVKMIYIDPPYNTGNDFLYRDSFKQSAADYDEDSGVYDEDGNRLFKNTDSNGRFHSDWCSMIYSRLMLARNLLSKDGIIFISIDDNEIETLTNICNEVFGESNAVTPFIWPLPRGINAGLVARAHEYILVYAKNIKERRNFNRTGDEIEYSIERCNKKIDDRHPESIIEFPAGIPYEGKDQVLKGCIEGSEKITIIDELVFKDGILAKPAKLSAGWTMKNMILDWISGKEVYDLKGQRIVGFFFKENGKLYSKKEMSTVSIKSVLKDMPDTQIARKEMEALFGSQDIFSYPKTLQLPKLLAQLSLDRDDIVIDFFSGSATTAHAIMQLNAEDGGHRKFIMVQLPEPCDEKSEAYKAGYHNICEIGKERIRRAGAQILECSLESLEKEGVIEKYAGKLSKAGSLEEIYGYCGGNLSIAEKASERRNLCAGGSDAASGSVDSIEHRRGTITRDEGIHLFFESGTGITCGAGNTIVDMRTLELLNSRGYRIKLESFGGNQQNAFFSDKTSWIENLRSKLSILSSDRGFRVLKLDDSNMKDVYYAPVNYDQNLLDMFESNIKEDRTDLDLLFGCLLEWGLPLSLPYSSEQIDGCTVHNYNDGDLIACFDENIPDSVIKTIAKRQPLRTVFRDSSFASSPAKINVTQIFKELAPDTSVKVL